MINRLLLASALFSVGISGDVYDDNNFENTGSDLFCVGEIVATGNPNRSNDKFTVACVGNKLFSATSEGVGQKKNITPVTNLGFPCYCNPMKGKTPVGILYNTKGQWQDY